MGWTISVEQRWLAQLGDLRNVIRQEMIRRQLKRHVEPGSTVLDIGGGQGTQLLRLAERGCSVTGLEPSEKLRRLCRAEARHRDTEIELIAGDLGDANRVLFKRCFDVVCAHGLLMYLDDRDRALETMAARVGPNGLISLAFRNGDSLAMRPGVRRNWAEALSAFDGDGYINGLGAHARADRLHDVVGTLRRLGFSLVEWYGVRVFNDAVAHGTNLDPREDLQALLDAEDIAGRRDPYRSVAGMIHVVARRC